MPPSVECVEGKGEVARIHIRKDDLDLRAQGRGGGDKGLQTGVAWMQPMTQIIPTHQTRFVFKLWVVGHALNSLTFWA